MNKKTLVLGASENPSRYSNLAIHNLRKHRHDVLAIGKKNGMVEDVQIETGLPNYQNVNTVTVYLNPLHQQQYYNYILKLKPERIIFNPGAENEELRLLAEQNNIATEEACTLVLLNIGAY